MLTVRGPLQAADISVAALGELLHGTRFHVVQIHFRFAAGVSDPGNPLAVRAPGGAPVVGIGRAGEVAGDPLPHGHVKYFPAGGHHYAGTVGGQAGVRELVLHVFPQGAGIDVVGPQGDGNLGAVPRGRVQPVQPAAVLEDDTLAVRGGELDVVFGEMGYLAGLTAAGVVGEQVHGHVPVAGVEDVLAHPHGENILGVVVGDVAHFSGLGIPDPDIVGHAAAVILPGAEFAHHAVVGQFFTIRGITAPAAFREGKHGGHAAFGAHIPELSGKAVFGAVAEHDALAVRAPCHHDVVGAHAVSQVVAGIGGGIGDAHRFAAPGGDAVHLAVAVVLSGEGDGLAVRGIAGKDFIADMAGQAPGLAAPDGNGPEVSRVGENHIGAIGGRKTQEAGFLLGRYGCSDGQQQN